MKQLILGIFLVLGLLAGCAPQVRMPVLEPAKIETAGIKKVALGRFEIAQLEFVHLNEANGKWTKNLVPLSPAESKALSDLVRARVTNQLAATPYFDLVFTDEFAQIESDQALGQMIAAQGFKTKEVDGLITGKLWLQIIKTDGADVSAETLRFVLGGRQRQQMDFSVDKVIWWPYKSMRASLALELRLLKLQPAQLLAVETEQRSFAKKFGTTPLSLTEKLNEGLNQAGKLVQESQQKPDQPKSLDSSDEVFPSFTQAAAELSSSIATNFVRKIAVTQKWVSYPLATGGDDMALVLIQGGAYQKAAERLQQISQSQPNLDDLYNLGLCFEALGEYSLAELSYQEALSKDPTNLLYAQGMGRVEQIKREHPLLARQLANRKKP